ncbi:RNA methyltransferase, RsmE family [Prevotella dentalis DSM 3688]|uniref:Ribosomal RNA small subunit methyltransferase E n=1 Tax=Prevotella dentalis (strain ATCC 49559 / DSM 3688 / JCM 13448 / NCTC 12043 / ES 2772) TaxID=908937 RepID=F9CZR7_PREDD|nr:16S rRNA (uracil(1498)-N(3))-methyltransferase [Prevotella dentalis]AGB28020.1 RNA methyltransferase, RsmE family [Prevotella dentalis DSM 3688]EGQ17750.1 RsmE family RNA methyltransferase [Prevotella dentalis DSM 3688]
MKEARYFYVPHADQSSELPADETHHAVRVLRLQRGDEFFLMDGAGTIYRAEVTLASGKHCMYKIVEALPQSKTWNGHIHLAIAPTKMMERMEWMMEKITEIGFDEASFLNCKFSERKELKLPRLERIVVSAVKQSRKPWMPQLNGLMSFSDFIRQPRQGKKWIAHCYQEIEREDLFDQLQQTAPNEAVTILVGPEGDFSTEEVRLAMEHGYEPVSLGNSRLRTETAGMMAVSMSQIAKRKS